MDHGSLSPATSWAHSLLSRYLTVTNRLGNHSVTALVYARVHQISDRPFPIGKLAMVASTVSSKMLEAIAAAEGFRFVECLTGETLPHAYDLS